MHGTFWFGYIFQDLIFSGLNISSLTGFVLACTCIFGTALIYETLKITLALTKLNAALFRNSKGQQCISDELVLIESRNPIKSKRCLWLLSETGVYTFEVIFGYMIMLIVMTYNTYFLMTLLFASALCYSLYGQRLYEIKLKTTKLEFSCNDCNKQKKCSSPSSSTEGIAVNLSTETSAGSHTTTET